ncbi:ABC transporter ATP-binding protein [Halobellus sp. EA9]|uniref:ABC transporter ATP-binding protein n=1 Tax=Halobellus sp. EA9 TaxID=3421647 RepID=UPI003EB9D559
MTLEIDVSATFTAEGAEAFEVDAAFAVERGETVVVLGPSGSGKSLLLETIAGFHDHDGEIALDDADLTATPPESRDFGFVFQDYALFPHLSIRENVRFGGRYRQETGDADELLSRLGIGDLAERYPPTLSGGEKQRVALARSLYVEPEILLLDEPLSSLDVPTRDDLRRDMLDVLDGVTAVYVTHDRTTARMLADRIVLMNDGEVVQRGTPEAIFERPASPFVARFTGGNCVSLSNDAVRTALDVRDPSAEWVAFRPENVRLSASAEADGGATLSSDGTATIESVIREDAAFRVSLSVGGERFDAFATDPPAVGSPVDVAVDESARTLL